MRCPECGLENLPQLRRCLRCGRGLERQLTPWSQVLPPRRAGRVGRAVQSSLAQTRRFLRTGRRGVRRWWNLVWYQVDTSREDLIARRSPTLAALLSFLPGLGHAYARRFLPALGLFAPFVLGAFGAALSLRSALSNVIFYSLVGLQAAAMAWSVAEVRRQNGDAGFSRRLVGALLLTVGLLSGLYTLGWLGLSRYYRPMVLNHDLWSARAVRAPLGGTRLVARRVALHAGDGVLVDVRPAARHALKPGDLVVLRRRYEYPGFAHPHGLGVGEIVVQAILAGPGDTLVAQRGAIWRNGRPLRDEELPYIPLPLTQAAAALPPRFVVGEDRFAVVTYTLVVPAGHAGLEAEGRLGSLTTVRRSEIEGKVIAIYNPPAHRRTF